MNSIVAAFAGYNLDCRGDAPEWDCTAQTSGPPVYYTVSIFGPTDSQIEQLEVALPQYGARNDAQAQAFLGIATQLRYATSNPPRAKRWMLYSWASAQGSTPAEADIGQGHFVLRVLLNNESSRDYSLQLLAAGVYYP